jgi:hypothetical protein
VHCDQRFGVEFEQSTRTRAALAEVALFKRNAASQAENFAIIGEISPRRTAEARAERTNSAIGQPDGQHCLHQLDQIDPVRSRAVLIERFRVKLLRENLACPRNVATSNRQERCFVPKSSSVGGYFCCDFDMSRSADKIIASAHGARDEYMQSGIRGLGASKLLKNWSCLSCAAACQMNAHSFECERSRNAATAELLREQNGSFSAAICKQQDARKLGACTRKGRSLRDCAAIAMLRALEVASCKQAARDFQVRCCGAINRVQREVVRRFRFFVPAVKGKRSNHHGNRSLTLRVYAQRRFERGGRFCVAAKFCEDQALGKSGIAGGWEQRRRLAIELQRFVVTLYRLKRPTEVQHPITATRITCDSRAKFALCIRKTSLAQHFARSIRVMFALSCVSHNVPRRYAESRRLTRGIG